MTESHPLKSKELVLNWFVQRIVMRLFDISNVNIVSKQWLEQQLYRIWYPSKSNKWVSIRIRG